jgi:hypothetical protein
VGGYLTLKVGAARANEVAAIAVEEPFSFPFIGISIGDNSSSPNTSKLELLDIAVLHIRGDQTPNINDFNRDVFLPEVEKLNLSYKVLTYPDELHSFAFYDSMERTLHPAVSLEVFSEIDDHFRQYSNVQPQAMDRSLVEYVSVGWGD